MKTLVLVVCAAGAMLTACQTDRDFASSQFDSLPGNVHSAIREEIGDARILDFQQERRTGNWVYEVSYLQDGEEAKLEVREDGAVLSETEPDTIEEAAGTEADFQR